MRYLQNCWRFFREFRRDFHHTGSILPSSSYLARAMVRPLTTRSTSSRILEVGPGTGAVTGEILRQLRPDDRFDIVEINPHFVQLLRDRLEGEWKPLHQPGQVTITNSGIEQLKHDGAYNYIISGLPLNNFRPSNVRQIFRTFRRLVAPEGILTFFEYVLIREMKTPFVGHQERRRLRHVGHIVGSYISANQVGGERVYANIPPAMVRHLHLKPL